MVRASHGNACKQDMSTEKWLKSFLGEKKQQRPGSTHHIAADGRSAWTTAASQPWLDSFLGGTKEEDEERFKTTDAARFSNPGETAVRSDAATSLLLPQNREQQREAEVQRLTSQLAETEATAKGAISEVGSTKTVVAVGGSAGATAASQPSQNVGVGLELYSSNGAVRIKRILPCGPAAFCGKLALDDVIIGIDHVSCVGKTVSDVTTLIGGPSGSIIHVCVRASIDPDSPAQGVWMLRSEILHQGAEEAVLNGEAYRELHGQYGKARFVGTAVGTGEGYAGIGAAVAIAEHVWSVESIKAGGGAWLGMSLPEMLQANLDGCMQHSLIQGDVIESVDGVGVLHLPSPLVLRGECFTRVRLGIVRGGVPLSLDVIRSRVLDKEVVEKVDVYRQALLHALAMQVLEQARCSTGNREELMRLEDELKECEEECVRGSLLPSVAPRPASPLTLPGDMSADKDLGLCAEDMRNRAETKKPSNTQELYSMCPDSPRIPLVPNEAPNVASLGEVTSFIHADLDKMLASLNANQQGKTALQEEAVDKHSFSDALCHTAREAWRMQEEEQQLQEEEQQLQPPAAPQARQPTPQAIRDPQTISEPRGLGILAQIEAILGNPHTHTHTRTHTHTHEPLLEQEQVQVQLRPSDEVTLLISKGGAEDDGGGREVHEVKEAGHEVKEAARILYLLRQGYSDRQVLEDRHLMAAGIRQQHVKFVRDSFKLPLVRALPVLPPLPVLSDKTINEWQRQSTHAEANAHAEGNIKKDAADTGEAAAPSPSTAAAPSPSIGLDLECAPGQNPVIGHVHLGSPAHNAGLLQGDRLLSVSATKQLEPLPTITNVKGLTAEEWIALLRQTLHSAIKAGGKMIIQVERRQRHSVLVLEKEVGPDPVAAAFLLPDAPSPPPDPTALHALSPLSSRPSAEDEGSGRDQGGGREDEEREVKDPGRICHLLRQRYSDRQVEEERQVKAARGIGEERVQEHLQEQVNFLRHTLNNLPLATEGGVVKCGRVHTQQPTVSNELHKREGGAEAYKRKAEHQASARGGATSTPMRQAMQAAEGERERAWMERERESGWMERERERGWREGEKENVWMERVKVSPPIFTAEPRPIVSVASASFAHSELRQAMALPKRTPAAAPPTPKLDMLSTYAHTHKLSGKVLYRLAY